MPSSVQTVLVFGSSGARTAVLTSVTATPSGKEGITFCGPVKLVDKVTAHIDDILLPLVSRLLHAMGKQVGGFDISIANLSAASVRDQGIEINGYSADASLVLAMLSSALKLDVRDGFVCTGHVSSIQGDLAMVSGLPAKLRVVMEIHKQGRFCYPDIAEDSLERLRPRETKELDHLLREARQQGLTAYPLSHLSELFRHAFPEPARWIASLRQGWTGTDAHDSLVQSLSPENGFFEVLRDCLLGKEFGVVRRMLSAYVFYHERQGQYPADLHTGIQGVIQSLPPAVIRWLRKRELFVQRDLEILRKLAGDSHDVEFGQLCDWRENIPLDSAKPGQPEETEELVREVLEAIHPHRLAELMIPVDRVRASFPLDDVRAGDSDVFWQLVTSYHVHLLQSVGELNAVADMGAFLPEAMDLVDRAFEGGHREALYEALEPRKGGLNHILNRITECFKRQRMENRVKAVFASEVDPLDFRMQLDFVEAFFELKRDALPRSVLDRPPESFLGNWQDFVRAYVEHEAVLQERLMHRC